MFASTMKSMVKKSLVTASKGFTTAISNAPAKRILVTGSAGQIAYQTLFRIAA